MLSGVSERGAETRHLSAVLLVEDNLADVKITQRAVEQCTPGLDLLVLRDGQEAADYLLRQGAYSALATTPSHHLSPPARRSHWRRPDLVLLDLNLPRLSGVEVLRKIREAPPLRYLPVVVLSTSRRPEDVQEAYAAGASTYVEKPRDFDRFVEVLRTVQQYWLETALLPSATA